MRDEDIAVVPIFAGLDRLDLEAAGPMTVRHFIDRDRLLEREGQRRTSYAILSGRVRIEVKGIALTVRGPGEVVGEQAFIDDLPHSADIIADGDVRAIEIPPETMNRLLLNNRFARNALSSLSHKLRQATNDRYVRYAERERLFASFGEQVGRRHRDRLLEDEEDFGRPQFRHDAVVMFTDIRGFTGAAHTMNPMFLADDVDRYVSMIVDEVHSADGFVSAFIGDGTMSFWGYPGIPIVSCDRILEAAKGIVDASRLATLGGDAVRTGIGIHVGDVFMGNVGSAERRQYTILGDTVNIASRLESLTKNLGGDIICTSAFYARLSREHQAGFVEHKDEPIRGVDEPCTVYSQEVPNE